MAEQPRIDSEITSEVNEAETAKLAETARQVAEATLRLKKSGKVPELRRRKEPPQPVQKEGEEEIRPVEQPITEEDGLKAIERDLKAFEDAAVGLLKKKFRKEKLPLVNKEPALTPESTSETTIEKKEKEKPLERPQGVSLSARLNEIKDKPELLEQLTTQLKGEKVYHFKKGVKQYLTVDKIREVDGKWFATLVSYGPKGEIEATALDYKVDKIKFKHWKKELPKMDEEVAYIRDEKATSEEERYKLGSIKELDPEKIIKYEYDGGVAYAQQSEGRPKPPQETETPGPEMPGLKGTVNMEVEDESDKEKADGIKQDLQETGFEDPEKVKEYHEFLIDLIRRYEELIPDVESHRDLFEEDVEKDMADIEQNIEHYTDLLTSNELPVGGLEEFKKGRKEIYKGWKDKYVISLDEADEAEEAEDLDPLEVDEDNNEDVGENVEEEERLFQECIRLADECIVVLSQFKGRSAKRNFKETLRNLDAQIEMLEDDKGKFGVKKLTKEVDYWTRKLEKYRALAEDFKIKQEKKSVLLAPFRWAGRFLGLGKKKVEKVEEVEEEVPEEEIPAAELMDPKEFPKEFTPSDILKVLKVEAGVNASAQDVWNAVHEYRRYEDDKNLQIDDVIEKLRKDADGTFKSHQETIDTIKKYFGLKEKNNE